MKNPDSGLAVKTALACWHGWFFVINILIFLLLGYQNLDLIMGSLGNFIMTAGSSDFDGILPNYTLYISTFILAFISYLSLFVLLPSLAGRVFLIANKKSVYIITNTLFMSISLIYLCLDNKIFTLFHYHINTPILDMIFNQEVLNIFNASWLEITYIIGIVIGLMMVESCIAYAAWKYSIKHDSHQCVKIILLSLLFISALSAQLFLNSTVAVYGEMIGITILMILLSMLFLSWKSWTGTLKPQQRFVAWTIPIFFLLITIIATSIAMRLTLYQAFLLSVTVTLIAVISSLISRRNFQAIPLYKLVFTCLLVSYQSSLLGYASSLGQIIQISYLTPLRNQLIDEIITSYPSGLMINHRLNNQYVKMLNNDKNIQYPLHPLINKHRNHPYNIVFIIIDTWRYDSFNSEITPNIYHFAKNALQFTNHWSGGNSTQAGIFSLFYSLPSTYWTSMLEQQKGPVFLHELLKSKYEIGIFASAGLISPAFYKTVFREVPDLYIKPLGNSVVERDQNANYKFEKFLSGVARSKQPFFSMLFYDGAHGFCTAGNPIHLFQPEDKVCGRFKLDNDSDPIYLFNRYRNALFRIDLLVSDVFKQLAKNALLENTIVIITGDHGQEFNDNHLNYWEHGTNYTRYQVKVPLIVYWPNQTPRKIRTQTSHYDIVPTLMSNAMGYMNPVADYSIGTSLFGKRTTPEYLIAGSYMDFAILENKRITTISENGTYTIYDDSYRALPNASLDSDIIIKAMNDLHRFHSDPRI